MILNGELYRGTHDGAGEVGHLSIDPEGLPCPCGSRGCFELYASGTALLRTMREDMLRGVRSRAFEAAGHRPENLSGALLSRAAAEGDEYALCLYRKEGYYLGVGIANLLVDAMVATGVSREAALQRFWGLSSRGLLVQGGRMRDFQEPFARPTDELAGWHCRIPGRYELADVVHNVQPTILIGTSAQPGAFTEQIAREMASYCERPIIMPLSNPTARAEALPADLLAWTDGRAMIATGSPFGDVIHDGTRFEIAQANNALIFPGIGLGVVTCHASRVTDTMVAAAAAAVSSAVTDRRRGASLLPRMSQLRAISARVALAVAETAEAEGLAGRALDNPVQQVYEAMWQPRYPEIEVVAPKA